MDKDMRNYVDFIARILDLENVKVRDDKKHLLDDFTFAGYVAEQGIILVNGAAIKKKPQSRLLLYLLIAHELRHMWQAHYHYDEYFAEGYIVDDMGREYECQLCEVDADAFSYLMLDFCFNKHPSKGTWKTFSYDLIMARVDEIYNDIIERYEKVIGQAEE